jgi:hypothetical protein
MPLAHLLLWLIGAAAFAVLSFVIDILAAPSEPLDITDVFHLYRRVDTERLMELLDPLIDEAHRPVMSRAEFSRLQRKRLRMVKEYLERLRHDAVLFLHIACQEQWKPEGERTPEDMARFKELARASCDLNFYAVYALGRIRFWMRVRTQPWCPFPPPRLSRLRTARGLDLVACYSRYTEAVSDYGLVYGRDLQEVLLFLLDR